MPKVNPAIDWQAALALYCQRLTTPEIARQTGCNLATLKSRIVRERWIEKRALVNQSLVATNQERAANALQRSGDRTRTKAATVTESLVDSLSERKIPRSLEGTQMFADALQKTVKTASIVHGWENTTLNAIIMPGDTDQYAVEEPAIDVASTAKQVENGNS